MGITGMAGIFSFHDGWDVGKLMQFALESIRHRGNDEVFIATLNGDAVNVKLMHGNIDEPPSGWAGIICTSSDDSSFGYIECGNTKVAYCIEGPLINSSNICDLVNNMKGTKWTSVMALTNTGQLIIYRPTMGLRNLLIGAYGFDLAIVSNEAATIRALGGFVRENLKPGEITRISRLNIERRSISNGDDWRICPLELIYISRLDNEVDGVPVYEFRRALARKLAKRIQDLGAEFDTIIGVPETGMFYAVKVGEEVKKPVELALMGIKRRRSALTDDLMGRLSSIHLKVHPIPTALMNKRVLVIDDSVLTGLTIKEVSQSLRHVAGVREVHVAIASPRIVRSCPYGVEMPDDDQLLISRFNNLRDVLGILEVDSITWLELNDLMEVGMEFGIENRLCTYCMMRDGK